MLETRFLEAPGGRVRMARLGSGPPLVLLHGYPDNLQIFCALGPRLATAGFEVVAFDWPGMGDSEAWRGGTTPQQMAERLLTLLDEWRIGRATLVGMDMGGQPALVAAAETPERVEALVVMNSLVFVELKASWEIRVLRRYRWNERLLRHLPRVVFAHALRSCLPTGERLPPELRADLWRCFRRPAVRTFVSRMCGGYEGALSRLPDRYARIRCPTLVLWGERDRHFPPSQGVALQAAIPGSRLEVLPRGEHWMAWHEAERVGACIAAFLRRAERDG